MKKLHILCFTLLLLFTACKKETVDATNRKTFQSSINDLASSLTTLQQVKFNEALYILKTFGVQGDTDSEEIANLGQLLNGKKVPDIFALADQVAQKNGIAWSSTAPPSLGEMNIFADEKLEEFDANDVKATGLAILTTPSSVDSVLGPKAIQVIPRLVDTQGNRIQFSGAALETVMEVYNSAGTRLLTSKNLMQDNNFKGFNLRMSALPREKVQDGKIDITISVKSTKKTYKMTRMGIPINTKALLMPQMPSRSEVEAPSVSNATETSSETITGGQDEPSGTPPAGDPKNTVSTFLSNLGTQNLKGAYNQADNPNWGSFDNFSNPANGFGAVRSITVKNLSTNSTNANSSSVNATYDITDKDGKTTSLNVTFGLKNVGGEWKISSYRIK